ncbi:MAG: 1-deoxy-D-xylulose-5-phosphate synthase [Kiritimatiellae bacterium]|nr:1-deoxy-D-xylulose-5-phosphate synthase [Kiritimatiellia bacterium]
MSLLASIQSPDGVKRLESKDLPALAEEIRTAILETVSRNGGHLASSLGVVELTIELLRVFSPPADKVVWDVGHQTYAWKLLTGRRDRFGTLRKLDGISGFCRPQESPYDATISGHAGVALSAALGMAVARDLHTRQTAEPPRHVIAVVGDGCMTNGISLEALNGLSDAKTKLIVILNDNEMSISQNVGALSRRLGRMLVDVHYNRIKRAAENAGHRLHMTFLRGLYHRVEQIIKSLFLKNTFFEAFGLRYVGPIDGHDFKALHNALLSASEYDRPVLIHVATQKGMGYPPAERAPSQWHGVGPFNLETGEPRKKLGSKGFSQTFGEEMLKLAEEDRRIVAVTAAMEEGTGLVPFANRFPDRFFDVGICEEHAAVFCSGLAADGFRPVFAVYSTFLQRAVDCVMHDICLANLPVLFCVDRAGVVGADGPTHHGVFDIPMLRCLPNLTILQPCGASELCAMMRWALAHNGPVVIRYPRQAPAETDAADVKPEDIAAGATVVLPLPDGEGPKVWIWALGDHVSVAKETAERLRTSGIRAGVVNARFVKPLSRPLLERCADEVDILATMENGVLSGGFGSAVREALSGKKCRVLSFGWPDEFIPQGTAAELAGRYGLTASQIAETVAKITK